MHDGTVVESSPGRLSPREVDVEQVIRSRSGDVLIKQTLLKADHFPGCQNTKLKPSVDGAPNFRQVDGLPIYGMAIPTVTGLRNVLDYLGATGGQKRVYWYNMREEPLIYVNGKPYVVREADQPFCNVEYTGIDQSRVEDMERRLKLDILHEAHRFDNQILVAHENDEMQVVEAWEPVTEADVQTPREVYDELAADGYDVDYLRVPVTDETTPKHLDFELLIQRLWGVPQDAALIFNCQMGRGRTTTGMIIASLLLLRWGRAFPRSVALPNANLPPWFLPDHDPTTPSTPGTPSTPDLAAAARDMLLQGQYGVVRSLLRVLERGVEGKAVLDAVVDACAAMQNLREAIVAYRGRILAEGTERKRNMLMSVSLKYLERYYMLIVFASYLCTPAFCPDSPNHISFTDWTNSRPELQSILSRMLRRNAMSALELHKGVKSDKHPTTGAADVERLYGEDGDGFLLELRSGLVLGPNTILKQDHYPGMKSAKVPQLIEGAPNFRGIPGMPVYGVAISTVEGIKGVLKETAKGTSDQCTWINMREEPVVYLHGQPYVLREAARPLKNLMEYAGIDAPRLELMEQRLKADMLAEAAQYKGRLLVTREAGGDGQAGTLQDEWVEVEGDGAVQTPAEVYQQLNQEGFKVTYLRVPVTDGTSPSAADFDVIHQSLLRAGVASPVVFNCQVGIGRTTTGMTIAGLLHIHHRLGPDRPRLAAVGSLDNLQELTELGPPPSRALPATWSFGVTDAMSSSPTSTPGMPTFLTSTPLRSTPVHSNPLRSAPSPIPIPSHRLPAHSPRHTPPLNSFTASLDKELGLMGTSPTSTELYDEQLETRLSGSASPESHMEVSEEEVLEQRAMAAGAYVGVRKVARLLEGGDSAKKMVDFMLDSNAQMVNLRVAIMQYVKPLHSYKYIRTEMNQRHVNFRRGCAYLERYCLLIAFASYLDQGPGPSSSFDTWISARSDLQQALASLHANPAAALAPVTFAAVPSLYQAGEGSDVDLDEQRLILAKRRGRTLTKRTILKSYQMPITATTMHPGFSDLRQVVEVPIYSVGNITQEGLRQLLQHLGAGQQGGAFVVVSDLREELLTYVNGTPYIRRELEMPAAALHHAGVQAKRLEELESLMVHELKGEVVKWSGQLLLHREVPRRPTTDADTDTGPMTSKHKEDITRVVDAQPGAAVVAFWESVSMSGEGLNTAKEIIEQLQREGFALSYRRIPLSRERTPEAADLSALHAQLRQAPLPGRTPVHLIMSRTSIGSSARFAAAALACALEQRVTSPRTPRGGSWDGADDSFSAARGEYRGIMSACRVLPGGTECKEAVDRAIDAATPIGNLRDDILQCTLTLQQAPPTSTSNPTTAAFAARQLGIHYLRRYFLLLAFRCFLNQASTDTSQSFTSWMEQRAELAHLTQHLALET